MSLEQQRNDLMSNVCEPEPLRAPIVKAEPYPVDALGAVLGGAAKALHESTKTPLALCCQSVLASASLAVQAHFDIKLPWGDSKPLSLFLLTVAESGERKSAIDKLVLGAAKAQEEMDMMGYDTQLKVYQSELDAWKAQSKENNRKAASAKNQESSEAAKVEVYETNFSKPEPPISPIRFVEEPTVEGLFKLLAVSQPSVGLLTDEGGALIGGHAMNSDNKLKTMAWLCKFWDGSPLNRVRAGDGSSVLYGRRLTLHLMAQPNVMMQLLGDDMANGQGFLARCLVAFPDSTIGFRQVKAFENPLDRNELKRLFAVLKTLMVAEPRTKFNPQVLDPIELPLSADAESLALNAVNEFETLMQSGEALCELRDRTAKAVENACRLAGVLAVIDKGMATREISVTHLKYGLMLMQWYLAEALRLKGAATVPQEVIDAEDLSRWLAIKGYKEFGTSLILQICPNQLRTVKRLKAAITVLVEHGYLTPNEAGTLIDGKKTKLSWLVAHYVL